MTVRSLETNDLHLQTDSEQVELADKNILIVVTGGIAAYKSCYLVRAIRRCGGNVRVVMTQSATEFVSPLSFATLSGNDVLSDMFPSQAPSEPIHLEASNWADIAVVAPATANIIGKVAHGIADDLCSTVLTACRKPVLFAPAMNPAMWDSPIVQNNIEILGAAGYYFIGPEAGEMGGVNESPGVGRMSEPDDILQGIEYVLSDRTRWKGRRVLVTTGPTREPLDPVRFVSNRSSGRMGDSIARQAYLRGASVTLVRGKSAENLPPSGPSIIEVDTAAQMAEAVSDHFDDADLLVMTAAVSDWTVEEVAPDKLKKKDGLPRISWKKTLDILQWAGSNKKEQVVVGFALETKSHLEEAKRKLTDKKADLIALNDATRPESAFGGDTIQLTLLHKSGEVQELPILSKIAAANKLLDSIEPLLRKNGE